MRDRTFLVLVVASSLATIALAGLLMASQLAHAQESGIASVYGGSDGLCGRPTASGERFKCSALTAASKTLPLGSHARVCTSAGRCVIVRINDRGPYVHGRIIDLSPAAASTLGISGLGHVTVERTN